MKPLVFIFLISVSNVFSDNIDGDKKIIVKSYPKKVVRGLYQIHNAGKYVKATKATTKRNKDNDYTVFPDVPNDKLNIPESPYFPREKEPDQKRVKKVLSDYHWHLRSKRSVVKNVKKSNLTQRVGNQIHIKPPRTTLKQAKKVEVKPLKVGKRAPRTTLQKAKKVQVKPLKVGKSALRTTLKKAKKVQVKPLKVGRREMVNEKRNPRLKKQTTNKIGNKPKHPNFRKRQNATKVRKNNNLKPTPKTRKSPGHRTLRSMLGKKQANKLLKSRRDFVNKTKPKKGARRLIAARDAMIEMYPYVVSIQKDKEHWCAGALLNPRMVITTANCLWKANRISRMKVRAGSRHTDRGGQVANIQEVRKHPGWKIRKNPDNDVALLLLDRNLKFSDTVHSVDLPNRVMMPAFEDAWITSWGSERRDGVFEADEKSLQVYHARVMDRPKCNNVTKRFGVTVSPNFICLAQTGRRAPCTRDTGAPAVSDGVLWGLASWGIRKLCGTERFPAMFSYLGAQQNLDFIINATHYLMSDERFYPFPDRVVNRHVQTSSSTAILPY